MEPGRKSPSSPICCSKEERCCSNALSGTGMSTSLPSVSHTLGNSARLPNQPGAHILVAHPSWRVDETYIKVKGQERFLYRAVDSSGQTIDFLLTAKRDTAAAKR